MRMLEALLPGVQDDLVEAGARVVDVAADLAWLTAAGWGLRFASGIPIHVCSRELLDWAVRRRVAAQRGIRFVQSVDAVGLVPTSDASAVSGLLVRPRGGVGGQEVMPADLVVDASGRTSRLSSWLEAIGYQGPEETVVDAHWGYASRVFRRPTGADGQDWQALAITPAPPHDVRTGVLLPIEGDRWLVTLGGGNGHYPPTDEAGFLEFARSMRSPALYEAIIVAETGSAITGYRRLEHRLRHYDRLPRWPRRLLALGDGVCAANPIYAEGMTLAVLGALELRGCLARSHPSVAALVVGRSARGVLPARGATRHAQPGVA
jgi:2-polyprenyl-6-methoxyphenol hydroxylase-like FAD-dependent oxidoreductase